MLGYKDVRYSENIICKISFVEEYLLEDEDENIDE